MKPTETSRSAKQSAHRSRRLVAFFSAILLVMSIGPIDDAAATLNQPVAWDGYDTNHGNCCNGNEMDGWKLTISATTQNPGNYTCLDNAIGAHTRVSGNNGYQIEVGDVTCGGATGGADGSCSTQGGHAKFVENDEAGTYSCVQHGNFTLGQANSFRASRIYSATPGNVDYAAYIDGTEHESQYLTTTGASNLYSFGWAETSSVDQSTTCGPNNHDDASYDDIQRFDYNANGLYALNTVSDGWFNSGCFNIGNYSNQHFTATLN